MGIENILGRKEEVREVLDRLGIEEGKEPVDGLETGSKYSRFKYKPSDFLPPDNFAGQYVSTLGRYEWEAVAGQIIEKGKKEGGWVPITVRDLKVCIEQEMIDMGYLEETEEGYMLTEAALEQIAGRYLAEDGL